MDEKTKKTYFKVIGGLCFLPVLFVIFALFGSMFDPKEYPVIATWTVRFGWWSIGSLIVIPMLCLCVWIGFSFYSAIKEKISRVRNN